MNTELLDKAAASALCPMFSALAPVSGTIAVVAPVFGPAGLTASITAAKISALSALGAAATCQEIEIGPEAPAPSNDCWEQSIAGNCMIRLADNPDAFISGHYNLVKKIIRVEPWRLTPEAELGSTSRATLEEKGGNIVYAFSGAWPYSKARWYLLPVEGSECVSPGPDTPVTNPTVPDHIYVDETTNCNYTVKFEGFIRQTIDGPIQPVFEISSSTETRANGGRIGGCNLSPTIYVVPPNGPGGPPGPPIPPIPRPPDLPEPSPDDVPWWAYPLLSAAGGAAGAIIGQMLLDALRPTQQEASFILTAPCDKSEDGTNQFREWTFPEQKLDQRILGHQVAILEALQQHLDWKTPICREARPQKRGTWISTNWRSDADSPNSNRPLRKLFRYRSESTRTTDELQAYWSDFEWTSGPVCVIHKGAWWGTPQIWASTAEEGQRVIRRAGAEAGLDPDKTGEWIFSSSDSPRYGVSLKMRLAETNGERWVTRREGASGFPEL